MQYVLPIFIFFELITVILAGKYQQMKLLTVNVFISSVTLSKYSQHTTLLESVD